MAHDTMAHDKISVIVTVLNGAKWIDKCFQSLIQQTLVKPKLPKQQQLQQQTPLQIPIKPSSCISNINEQIYSPLSMQVEVCVFDDGSCDESYDMLQKWKDILETDYHNVCMHIVRSKENRPKGVGFGRNQAIAISTGNYLCFQDIDDEMLAERLQKQYQLAKQHKNAIIGSKFMRIPRHAMQRFTKWANELPSTKLTAQIYTSNGPTVIMPTWFCHRQVFDNVRGGFCEEGLGCPEDLIFFYKHLDNQGDVIRVEETLVKYRFHLDSTTFSVPANTIWLLRLQHFMANYLNKRPWNEGFSIWNAGKQGRRFFRHLSNAQKFKVKAFCDVDKKKVNRFYHYYDAKQHCNTFSIPIMHYTQVQPPIVICMKLDLTNGDFENNLQSLELLEGKDYILFT